METDRTCNAIVIIAIAIVIIAIVIIAVVIIAFVTNNKPYSCCGGHSPPVLRRVVE